MAWAAWTLKVGSFCLIMHQNLDPLALDERTVNAYWKARIIDIRKPRKDESVCDYIISMQHELTTFGLGPLLKSSVVL
jgi:hypothetical protein